MTMYGIDTSSWQAGLDPAAVPEDFIIIKATGGTGYVNPACDRQYQAARKAGKLVGIYHFAHEAGCPGTAAQEAAFFLANVKGYLDGDTLIVLDFEGDNWRDVGWAKAWLDAVHAATGVKPVIYLNTNELASADWSPVYSADYGLWVARYAVTTPTSGYTDYKGAPANSDAPPAVNWGGASPVMWQYADNAHLPNYAGGVDADILYGDANTWHAYCRPSSGGIIVTPQSSAPAPKPAPAPAPKPAPAPAPAPAPHGGPIMWIVDPGNTMGYIAGQVGVSLAALEAANPGVNPNLIYPGQRLHLPAGARWPGAAPAPAPHPVTGRPPYCRVTSGDTFTSIAKQFGVSLGALEAANPGINYNRIVPGQRVNLP